MLDVIAAQVGEKVLYFALGVATGAAVTGGGLYLYRRYKTSQRQARAQARGNAARRKVIPFEAARQRALARRPQAVVVKKRVLTRGTVQDGAGQPGARRRAALA